MAKPRGSVRVRLRHHRRRNAVGNDVLEAAVQVLRAETGRGRRDENVSRSKGRRFAEGRHVRRIDVKIMCEQQKYIHIQTVYGFI